MPQYVHSDRSLIFSYDSAQSTVEGRTVSTSEALHMVDSFSILLPSGTGSVQLWANNSNPTTQNRVFGGNQYGTLIGNSMNLVVNNSSFSANWVNITNVPGIVILSSSGFFVEGQFRFIRLQGASLTGFAGAIGYMWHSDCMND